MAGPDRPIVQDVEAAAARHALLPAATSERLLSDLTQAAVAEWRLQDATYWQRVKFRSRMIRAIRLRQG